MAARATRAQSGGPREPTDWERAAAARIANLRMRLLDLNNSNRLLNFKFSERSRSHVRVIEALPDAIFGNLVAGNRLTFRSLPERTDEPLDEKTDHFLMVVEQARISNAVYLEEFNALDDDPDGEETRRIERRLKDRIRAQLGLKPLAEIKEMTLAQYARLHDIDPRFDLPLQAKEQPNSHLQLLMLPDQMERSLSGISDQTRTTIQEKGVNTLCVAFGYLEWYESEKSDKPIFAPLLLQQIEIERRLIQSKYQYKIGSLEEETDVNVTLSERLGQDFGMRLPAFDEDDTPELYFSKLEKIIEDKGRWRVRRFVVVGHFAFARLVIYNDIDPRLWPGEVGIVGNSNILKLFAGGEDSGKDAIFTAEEYEVDNHEIASKVPLLITDADSSQFSAIVDVMDGKNLALKGPPGTGKSQTITNIIAAALAKGLRVLFVAEKMAALNVVKERLSKAGLGDFCFELHSAKARKKDLLTSLAARLQIQNTLHPPHELDAALAELEKHRHQLTNYVSLINTNFGVADQTVHHIFWAEQRSRDAGAHLPKALDQIRLSNVETLTDSDITDRRMKLVTLGELNQAIVTTCGAIDRHPWHGMDNTELNLFDQEELISQGERLHAALKAFHEIVPELSTELLVEIADDLATSEKLLGELDQLPPTAPNVDKNLLSALIDPTTRQALSELLVCIGRWTEAKAMLAPLGNPAQMSAQATEFHKLAEAVDKFNLADKTTATLSPFIEDLRTQRQDWLFAAKHGKQIFYTFGLTDEKLNLFILRRTLNAVRHLTALPEDLIESRSGRIVNDAAGVLLTEAAAKAKTIKTTLAEALQRLKLSPEFKPEDYSRHAKALRFAGVFAFLRSDVRAARSAYRSMLRGPLKISTQQMAEDFNRLAQVLLEAKTLDRDSRLRQLFGERFRGFLTDFDQLIAVRRWMIEAKQLTSGSDEINQKLQTALLEGDLTTLQGLISLANDPIHALLERLVEASVSTGGTIEDRIEWLDQRINAARMVETLARQIGLVEEAPFVFLHAAANAAEMMGTTAAGIASNQLARVVLGTRYQDVATDQRLLTDALNAAHAIEKSQLADYLKRYLFSAEHDIRIERLNGLKAKLASASTEVRSAWIAFRKRAELDEVRFIGSPFEIVSVGSLINRIALAIADRNVLASWVEYRRAWNDCARSDLTDLLSVFDSTTLSPVVLSASLDRVFYRSLARSMLERHPGLSRLHGTTQKQARARFQELDREILRLHQQGLAARLTRVSIDPGVQTPQKKDYTGLALIHNELSKKQRHLPVRTLLDRAGRSIQQMKPCFMMSPLSVAQFLKPGGLRFDLLVIDEASQMRPEDALGSIARSDQTVIVGDPMQLPPTSFFDRADHVVQTDVDVEEIVDSESILDLALAAHRPARELRWHYRSRHESLIAFSNRKFYNDKLIVFPSPLDPDKTKREPALGVFNHFVVGKYKSSLNLPEAQAVAEAAVAFMRDNPDRSLGVVTLNQAQREILLGEIDRLVARDQRAAEYREKWEPTLEPFFVKNLENVQGDERDVIFISTVYGPDADTGAVMNRFGPVNSNVGHRRLNVLFTRAKQRVDVFTSMRSDDIKTPDGSSLGVKVLKSYLEYAETGRLEQGEVTGREPDSDFEIFVRDRLAQHGFEVVPQVGVAGYFIDLAVKHPKRSGYLLGIECDGATYHSSKSARDRDRLREEVLIGLKWSIYRIWSTDWFANPEQEFKRLLAHIDQLISRTASDLLK